MINDLTDIWRAIHALEEAVGNAKTPDALYRDSGTYVPTYIGGTTAGTTIYSIQQGSWVRLGNLIIARGTVQWTAATGTGDARISLPFTAANVANQNSGGSVWITTVTFANSTPLLLVSPNTAYFILSSPLTNAANTQVAIEAAGIIVWTVAYVV